MNNIKNPAKPSDYYLFYDYLRKRPLVKFGGSWLVSKYEDVKLICNTPDIFISDRIDPMFEGLENTARVNFARYNLKSWILHRNVESKELKTALSKEIYSFFRGRMDDAIQEHLEDLLSAVAQDDSYDFRHQVAAPLVSRLLMEILKIPRSNERKKQEDRIFFHMQNIANLITKLNMTMEEANSIAHSMLYVIKLGPSFDGIDDNFDEADYGATYGELDIQKGALYHPFIHDTVNFLCNTLFVLYSNQDKFELSNLDEAINEALRLEAPVQAIARSVGKETDLLEKTLGEGEIITVLIGSAHRDESVPGLEDPHEFKLGRNVKLLNFGEGLHACIGQHLAKHIVKKVMVHYFSKGSFNIKETVWDEDIRTYRNMSKFIVATELN